MDIKEAVKLKKNHFNRDEAIKMLIDTYDVLEIIKFKLYSEDKTEKEAAIDFIEMMADFFDSIQLTITNIPYENTLTH